MTRAKAKKLVRKVVKRAKAAPPVAPPLDHALIASLLEQSRGAHRIYRSDIQAGRDASAREALQAAYDRRLSAEALDPSGVSPSWNEEGRHKEQHYALLKFYSEQLT